MHGTDKPYLERARQSKTKQYQSSNPLLILGPYKPSLSFQGMMGRVLIVDYLILFLAPLIAFIVSKIQLSASLPCYVVESFESPIASDLLISTKYVRIYANHTLAFALLVSISVLGTLLIIYSIVAVYQEPLPVRMLWKTELETFRASKNRRTLAKSRTTWGQVIDTCHSQIPDFEDPGHGPALRSVTRHRVTVQGDIELETLVRPAPALFQERVSLFHSVHKPSGATIAEQDKGDWESVYCDGWTNDADGEGTSQTAIRARTSNDAQEPFRML